MKIDKEKKMHAWNKDYQSEEQKLKEMKQINKEFFETVNLIITNTRRLGRKYEIAFVRLFVRTSLYRRFL